MTGIAYLAYPIDQQATDIGLVNGIVEVAEWFRHRGWATYDPGEAWIVAGKPDRRVMAVNNMALGRSDAVVAFLPPGVPSIGVPMEIDRAATSGIPTLVIGGEDSWALARYQSYPNVRIGKKEDQVEWCLQWLLEQAESQPERLRRQDPLPYQRLRDQEPEIQHTRAPIRAYDGDAGFDLVVSQSRMVEPGRMTDIPCNLAVELPEHTFGVIVGRSSTLRTKGLQVHLGVIDSGYRGELFAAVSTLGRAAVSVRSGERLAQLIVLPNASRLLMPTRVDQLNPSDRGSRGFGSSGR
jgi:dUTP pyrophosphatase